MATIIPTTIITTIMTMRMAMTITTITTIITTTIRKAACWRWNATFWPRTMPWPRATAPISASGGFWR